MTRTEGMRLFARDAQNWMRKRVDAFGRDTNDFSISPYRRD